MKMTLLHKIVACSFYFWVSVVFCNDELLGFPCLIISNNGPAILGSNMTFKAVLNDSSSHKQLSYTFTDGIQDQTVRAEANVSVIMSFMQDLYKEGLYNMSVTVQTENPPLEIASNFSSFELREYMIGKIIVHRSINSSDEDVDEVAVGENVTMAVQLYDANGYLKNAETDYMWSIDLERQQVYHNNLTYNYKIPGVSNIITTVVARLSDSVFKFGFFNKQLTVKVPVNSVNISGNPFLHHGEILSLNVSCNGSSPFEYCWRPLEVNETVNNLSCSQPIVSTTCNFPITRYFQNYGTYHIGIYISNDVKIVKRNIEVIVYNVSTKPQLSTVIIPIVCSLLTLIIIAGGIAYCIQQRNQLAIEVANFDFQDESESYVVKTFFEQIFDSIVCRSCNCNVRTSGDLEAFENEQEPLLTTDNLIRT